MSIKHRSVFKAGSVEDANRMAALATQGGIPDDDVHIIARSDTEVRRVSNRRKLADSDLVPAAMRGVLMGAVIGLVAGIAIMLLWGMPAYALILSTGIVAAMGGLGGSLAGASVRDPIRRHFRSELDAGSVLVIVDAEPEKLPAVQQALEGAGASRLAYDAATAMS
ncbi:hypothetical protein [Luteimonas sp. SDU101]|uniref:hypothetical protein n=1 Tax=unclassified Luteimonas TaxID=2629088 RepID=UPI003EC07BBD